MDLIVNDSSGVNIAYGDSDNTVNKKNTMNNVYIQSKIIFLVIANIDVANSGCRACWQKTRLCPRLA